ncbi:ACP S-malonyltransferase [Actinomadura syzygii]|uniref:[acyl-carrier-protein] S-malonyltransferase n=1 Tax=Actinomadura syzygii TaxID=1427538 RepID=A0A5D0UE93_9ACTN|nr:ACP S-malonyltransferase [Actinomadura syzygii]TYC16096.1 ACP S-malonyltransferase [Actinomadura syzygii]
MDTGPRAEAALVFPAISPSSFGDVGKFMLMHPAARRLVAEADDALGYSLVDRFRASDGEYTEPARVAFLVNCLAMAGWAETALDADPVACAGPSFGGTPAAVHSGALGFADAVRLTAAAGRHIEEYFQREHRGIVTQSFARTPPEALAEVLSDLDERGAWYDVSCYVDHDFYMLSVHEDRLDWLTERLRRVGGLPLAVMRPPMHSSAFGSLRDSLEREVFAGVEFRDPSLPVVSDHDGRPLLSGAELRTLLLDAAVRPVRWPGVMEALRGLGVGRLYVCGPDNLWGRVRCATDRFDVVSLRPELAMRPRTRRTPARASRAGR